LKEHEFRVFDVFTDHYWAPKKRLEFIEKIGLKHVPVVDWVTLDKFKSMDDILEYAPGKSVLANREREGVVFKGPITFKAVSNKYLEQ
jgi:ATP-dependent RNA circularization protein (DNA/RNA ligase family)